VLNGNPAQSASLAGLPVNFQGPKLDFYRFVANTSINTQGAVQGYVANVLQALQQTTTVAMYQVDGVALSVAVYPTDSFANAAVALSTANITYAGFQLDSCTDNGFKLSA
jgi:hypothetical protein